MKLGAARRFLESRACDRGLRHYVAFPPVATPAMIRPITRCISRGVGKMSQTKNLRIKDNDQLPSLLIGTGLAVASLILLPAIAQRIGLGSSLTIALRGALMRASNRA